MEIPKTFSRAQVCEIVRALAGRDGAEDIDILCDVVQLVGGAKRQRRARRGRRNAPPPPPAEEETEEEEGLPEYEMPASETPRKRGWPRGRPRKVRSHVEVTTFSGEPVSSPSPPPAE